jgi:hypothetical protein
VRPSFQRFEEVVAPDLQVPALYHLRGSRSAASHRDHAGVEALGGEKAREIAGDGRLSDPLARPDDRHGGLFGDRIKLRRGELEVAPDVASPGGEGQRGDPHPLPVPDDGLI